MLFVVTGRLVSRFYQCLARVDASAFTAPNMFAFYFGHAQAHTARLETLLALARSELAQERSLREDLQVRCRLIVLLRSSSRDLASSNKH